MPGLETYTDEELAKIAGIQLPQSSPEQAPTQDISSLSDEELFKIANAKPASMGIAETFQKAAKMQMGPMAAIPDILRSPAKEQGMKDLPERVGITAQESAKQFASGLMGIEEGIANTIQWAGDAITDYAKLRKDVPGLHGNILSLKMQEVLGSKLAKMGAEAGEFWNKSKQSGALAPDKEFWRGKFTENPSFGRATAIISGAIPSFGAAAAATIATGNPWVGAGMLGLIEGAPEYKKARSVSPDDPLKANLVGAANVVGTTVLEFLPLHKVLKTGGGSLKRAAVVGAQEGTEEALQTVWQNTVAKLGYDKTRQYFEGVVEAFIAGAGSGAAIGGLTRGNAQKLDQAEQEMLEEGVLPEEIEAMKETVLNQILANSGPIEEALQKQEPQMEITVSQKDAPLALENPNSPQAMEYLIESGIPQKAVVSMTSRQREALVADPRNIQAWLDANPQEIETVPGKAVSAASPQEESAPLLPPSPEVSPIPQESPKTPTQGEILEQKPQEGIKLPQAQEAAKTGGETQDIYKGTIFEKPAETPSVPVAEVPAPETKILGAEQPTTEAESKIVEKTEVPRSQLPVTVSGKGYKIKPSGLAERLANKLESIPEGDRAKVPQYRTMNKKEQIEKAADYVTESPGEAMEVLKGEREAPKGLLYNSIYIALQEHASASKDASLILDISSLRATRQGQEISILTEAGKESPVRYISDLKNRRIEALKDRGKFEQRKKEIKQEYQKKLREELKTAKPKRGDWITFVQSIRC